MRKDVRAESSIRFHNQQGNQRGPGLNRSPQDRRGEILVHLESAMLLGSLISCRSRAADGIGKTVNVPP